MTDPGYPGTLSALALASATPVFFPLDAQGQPEFAAMERAVSVKTRAIFVASPNNPTGQILSAATWTQLASLAEMLDLVLIVDAAYEQLSWLCAAGCLHRADTACRSVAADRCQAKRIQLAAFE